MKAREIRKRLRAAEHRERRQYAAKIDRAFSRLSTGCSDRVLKAVTQAPDWRDKQTDTGSYCLQNVALYTAGFRTVRKDATHIIK